MNQHVIGCVRRTVTTAVRRSAPEVLHLPRVRAAPSAGAGLLVPTSVK